VKIDALSTKIETTNGGVTKANAKCVLAEYIRDREFAAQLLQNCQVKQAACQTIWDNSWKLGDVHSSGGATWPDEVIWAIFRLFIYGSDLVDVVTSVNISRISMRFRRACGDYLRRNPIHIPRISISTARSKFHYSFSRKSYQGGITACNIEERAFRCINGYVIDSVISKTTLILDPTEFTQSSPTLMLIPLHDDPGKCAVLLGETNQFNKFCVLGGKRKTNDEGYVQDYRGVSVATCAYKSHGSHAHLETNIVFKGKRNTIREHEIIHSRNYKVHLQSGSKNGEHVVNCEFDFWDPKGPTIRSVPDDF
jgi:hypothetical protein